MDDFVVRLHRSSLRNYILLLVDKFVKFSQFVQAQCGNECFFLVVLTFCSIIASLLQWTTAEVFKNKQKLERIAKLLALSSW